MYNQAQNRATQKYHREKLEQISFRVKKGERERYKAEAQRLGLSLNQLFLRAVEYYISENK